MSNILKTLPYDSLLEQRDRTEKSIAKMRALLQQEIREATAELVELRRNLLVEHLQLLADVQAEITLRERDLERLYPMNVLYRNMGLEFFGVYTENREVLIWVVAPPYHPTRPLTHQCYLQHIES